MQIKIFYLDCIFRVTVHAGLCTYCADCKLNWASEQISHRRRRFSWIFVCCCSHVNSSFFRKDEERAGHNRLVIHKNKTISDVWQWIVYLIANRTRYLKENPKGVSEMCKIMEDMRNESLKEVALRMLAAGKYALEEIANISGLSLDEVKKLEAEQTA